MVVTLCLLVGLFFYSFFTLALFLGTMESNSAYGISIFFSVFLMPLLITPPCNGGKILVFSLDGSHWINMKLMIEELHARGHSISVIRPSKSWYIEEVSPLYDSINIPQSKQFEDLIQGFLERYIRVGYCQINAIFHKSSLYDDLIMYTFKNIHKISTELLFWSIKYILKY